jgi:predicted MFS family arabinose efflux permease
MRRKRRAPSDPVGDPGSVGGAMNRNIRLLAVGMAVRNVGSSLYGPFIALFLHNVLALGYVEIGLIIVFIGCIQIPFSVLGGLVADRMRRKTLMIAGLTAEAIATSFLAYAFSIESLVLAITAAVCGGAVATLSGPAFSAYIADYAAGPERTQGFTLLRIGFNAGYAVGVSMGGLLIGVVGFAGGVASAAVLVAAATVALYVLLEHSPRDRASGADAAAVSPAPLRPGPAPAKRSVRDSIRILARDRASLEVAVAFALIAFLVGQWSIIYPLYIHNVLGISYSLLGIGLALNGLVVVFGQNATTRSVLGWRHTTIAVLGIAFYAVAFLGLGAAGLFGTLPVVVFFVSVVVLTVGENLVSIPQMTMPSNLAPPEEIGSYNGAFGAFVAFGSILSTLAGGAVLAFTANPLLIWVILLVPAVPAAFLLKRAAGRIPDKANRA